MMPSPWRTTSPPTSGPLGKCLEDVAASDLYVGVFAHRYGYVPDYDNPDRRSITELEYRQAQTLGIPRLLFLLEVAAPWPPPQMDAFTGDGDHGARIHMLREELGRERLVSFFATNDELAQKVSIAVTKQLAASERSYRLIAGLPAVPARRVWTIPPPVRSFTGREDQLAALHTQLTGQGAATLVPTAALTGMGGVGKTQLALAYAQRYRADYQLGWWVPAETELGIVTALADLGVVLGLPADLPPAELAAGARDGLGERSEWLVIFDNAPDPAAVAEFLPGAGGGHVLVTSRNSAWQGIADPVPVDLLPLGSAVELLLRRTGDLDEQAAAQLAEALDRLPLALEQAAAYAATERLRLARYLELFKERHAELLALGRPLAYQGTVDATFTLALDQLRAANPAAGQLLELCALLAPDEIPLPLLFSEPRLLPEPLAAAVADPGAAGGGGRIAVPPRAAHRGRYRDRPDSSARPSRHSRPPPTGRPPPADCRGGPAAGRVVPLPRARIRTSGRGLPSCSLTLRPCLTTPEPYSWRAPHCRSC